jgi:adenine-specific DNA methylase
MIPLEAARFEITAYGIDYSPVATLAGRLLADYPFRDWRNEPALLFGSGTLLGSARLLSDVENVLAEIGDRYEASMADFYPMVDGRQPWGYLWALTIPCQECGNRFPLTGSLSLRSPNARKSDPGQSYRIEADRSSGTFHAIVHDGPPEGQPTLTSLLRDGKKVKGKIAICPFCESAHPLALHQRLAQDGEGRDALLVAADVDPHFGKRYRAPSETEQAGATAATAALLDESEFREGVPAVPDEEIPLNNGATIRPQLYGARTYGDLCVDRQTLGLVRLARIIDDLGAELVDKHGLSRDYGAALIGYAASVMVRKIKRSTRGSTLEPAYQKVGHIYVNESTIAYSYDFFETGLGDGPGTWRSLAGSTVRTLRGIGGSRGAPASIERGSAVTLPFRDGQFSAVVTDPPYDAMVYYSDSSDLFFAWLKRALFSTFPELTFTTDPRGIQEKAEEIIVKEHGISPGEHRDRAHYDSFISRAFSESRRVVRQDGVVAIVFGHGEPEVWHRLLEAITAAGLVLTGSWPAKTEAGGQQGKANIVTTLTMSCRPAPLGRGPGRANLVEAEVRREVAARIPMWEGAGLAPTDQLMASAGPAMEVVGRYDSVLNSLGEEVEPDRYLLVARRAVEEAAAIEIDHLPLETFDPRTRFALSWVRLFGREIAAKSEARWQALASDLEMDQLHGILVDQSKGFRFAYAREQDVQVNETSEVVVVALAMARAWPSGLDAVGEVLAASQRGMDDPYLWAAMGFLSSKLPEADPDAMAWTGLVRSKTGVGSAVRQVRTAAAQAEQMNKQRSLFDVVDVESERTAE